MSVKPRWLFCQKAKREGCGGEVARTIAATPVELQGRVLKEGHAVVSHTEVDNLDVTAQFVGGV